MFLQVLLNKLFQLLSALGFCLLFLNCDIILLERSKIALFYYISHIFLILGIYYILIDHFQLCLILNRLKTLFLIIDHKLGPVNQNVVRLIQFITHRRFSLIHFSCPNVLILILFHYHFSFMLYDCFQTDILISFEDHKFCQFDFHK